MDTVTIENLVDIDEDTEVNPKDEDNPLCRNEGPVDWSDDDPRWGNTPTIGRPTVVQAKFLIDKLQDLDTVRGTIYVRIGLWCNWKDHRLAGRSRMDPLPENLWSPRPDCAEALGDFNRSTRELSLAPGTLRGHMNSWTWYEGTIKNPMDLRLFPLDTDTLDITFYASECYRRNGETNVNYKTDYRFLFDGWTAPPKATTYGWDLLSSKVHYTFHEHGQDVLQIQLNFQRCFNFYFFKVVFPLILITFLNFLGFSLDDDNLGERLANNISLFLSALALLYVVGQDIPKTTFLTAIDRIVIVTLSLIFVTGVHFVLLNNEALDKIGRLMYGAKKDISGELNDKNQTITTQPLINNTTDHSNIIQGDSAKHMHDHKILLSYVFGYMIYIFVEFLVLAFRRYLKCRKYKMNLDEDNVFLDGVNEHNERIKENVKYEFPAWLMTDPFRMVLMSKGDSSALYLPQPLTKGAFPVQLSHPCSGKAVVMSKKPAYQHDGKDFQWMTLGSPIRALEIVYDIDLKIKWASRPEQVFTVLQNMSKPCNCANYETGNEVVFYADMKEADLRRTGQTHYSQKFKVNADGTISPLKAPDLVLGMEATSGI